MSQLDATATQMVEQMAVKYLWNWTGQRYGLCPTVIRPCREDLREQVTVDWSRTYWVWNPAFIGSSWFNISCGVCGRFCKCGDGTKMLQLPGPIHSVTAVEVDAVVLPSTSYQLTEGRLLIRMDGESWPTSQDLTAPLGEPGTWAVAAQAGIPVPEGGQIAAGLLAEQFAKALCKDETCALPERWQTITRQGITVQSQDLFEDLEKGHTGIWLIDSWVASIRAPRRQTASVASPDYNYRRF